MNSKKILNSFQLSAFSFQIFLLFVVAFISLNTFHSVKAEEKESEDNVPAKVDYQGAPIVDSDFDGLTDQGEVQLFKTDPQNQDTDGDGFYDGSEVLRRTGPLDAADPVSFELTDQIKVDMVLETPWAWYVTRSAGLLGYVFLWLSVLLGLSIRNNWLKKIIQPIYSFEFHCFLGASALFFHGEFALSWREVYIPFYSKTNLVDTDYLVLGIMAFYAMVILVVTSYAKKIISHKVWRALHFLNPVAFVFVVLHGYFIGTDMHNVYIATAFAWSSIFLVVVYFSNPFFVLWNNWHAKHGEIDETDNSDQE